MKPVKDRHPDVPGEANRDKHINFLAEENGDTDPADETFDDNVRDKKFDGVDNGFFTNDDDVKSNAKEHHHNTSNSSEIIPVAPDAVQAINSSAPEGNK